MIHTTIRPIYCGSSCRIKKKSCGNGDGFFENQIFGFECLEDSDFSEKDEPTVTTNKYIAQLCQHSNLWLWQKKKILKAYQSSKELGLFHLFLPKQYLAVLVQ